MKRGLAGHGTTTLQVEEGAWSEVVSRLRTQLPEAASFLFGEGTALKQGFALVLNDEVVQPGTHPDQLRAGDEVFVIATIAGG